MRVPFTALIVLLTLGAPALADAQSGESFRWEPWRHLAVQDGGRQKPLDTLSWETLRTLCNRASFRDPETDQKLSSTALYLAMLFDWQGGDRPSNPRAAMMNPRASYFARHHADKWDRAPLLRVDFLALRDALGMPADEKYISPREDRKSGG